MFTRRVFGGTPDSFKLLLEFGPSHLDYAQGTPHAHAHVRLPVALATLTIEWNADEAEEVVVQRLVQQTSQLMTERMEERVVVTLDPHSHGVAVNVSVACCLPTLRCISAVRITSSGSPSEALLSALLKHLDLRGVWKLKSSEGFSNWWSSCTEVALWEGMRNLNLSYCNLSVLPSTIGTLSTLKILRLSHNKLSALPAEISQLTALEVLAADHNQLATIPAELRRCSSLRELNLEGNRLTTPVLDLRAMQGNLQSLQLFGNPLEYLPELSPCSALRSLSLANVRILADATYSRWEVEVANLSYMSRGHKLAPLFRLTFRRSSLQHPLLAGALGRLAEDRANCELISREEVACQQLVLMALSEQPVVVRQACKTIGHLATFIPTTVKRLITHDVLSAVVALMAAANQESQLCGLTVLSALAAASDDVSAQLVTPKVLARLHTLIRTGDPAVRQAALHSACSLCFCAQNRRAVLAHGQHVSGGGGGDDAAASGGSLLQLVIDLAQPRGSSGSGTSDTTRLMALRLLAVLGENEAVRRALRRPPITGRGLRVLSLDGGGMKGLTMVTLLRKIEARTQRPIHEMFDLIVGTSTGAIVAVAAGVLALDLDAVEAIYTKLGQKVFNATGAGGTSKEETVTVTATATATATATTTTANAAAASASAAAAASSNAGWRDSLYRMYKSSSTSMRVAVYGSKHDPSAFEGLLKDMCCLSGDRGCVGDQLIDASCLPRPKVAVVSTLTSVAPATPFIFRTYEVPLELEAAAQRLGAPPGSSKHLIWQAVRASSAAPYYLDEFSCGEDTFQDGAASANNPTLIAVQQARLLWPDTPLEVVVSLGVGVPPVARRERSVSTHLDNGMVLIETACSVERAHEAMSILVAMNPEVNYFRFQPVDERCAMELDDVDPASWARLQAAAQDYCTAHSARLDEVAELLMRRPDVEQCSEGQEPLAEGAVDEPPAPPPPLCLGPQRGLLLLEAPRAVLPGDASPVERLADALAAAQQQHLLRRANLAAGLEALEQHRQQQRLQQREEREEQQGAAAGAAAGWPSGRAAGRGAQQQQYKRQHSLPLQAAVAAQQQQQQQQQHAVVDGEVDSQGPAKVARIRSAVTSPTKPDLTPAHAQEPAAADGAASQPQPEPSAAAAPAPSSPPPPVAAAASQLPQPTTATTSTTATSSSSWPVFMGWGASALVGTGSSSTAAAAGEPAPAPAGTSTGPPALSVPAASPRGAAAAAGGAASAAGSAGLLGTSPPLASSSSATAAAAVTLATPPPVPVSPARAGSAGSTSTGGFARTIAFGVRSAHSSAAGAPPHQQQQQQLPAASDIAGSGQGATAAAPTTAAAPAAPAATPKQPQQQQQPASAQLEPPESAAAVAAAEAQVSGTPPAATSFFDYLLPSRWGAAAASSPRQQQQSAPAPAAIAGPAPAAAAPAAAASPVPPHMTRELSMVFTPTPASARSTPSSSRVPSGAALDAAADAAAAAIAAAATAAAMEAQQELEGAEATTDAPGAGAAGDADAGAPAAAPAAAAAADAADAAAAALEAVGGSDGVASDASGALTPAPSPSALLVGGVLSDLSSRTGVVHLGLQATADGRGLVVGWDTQVHAVVEPGPAADALVRELGHDPATTSLSHLVDALATAAAATAAAATAAAAAATPSQHHPHHDQAQHAPPHPHTVPQHHPHPYHVAPALQANHPNHHQRPRPPHAGVSFTVGDTLYTRLGRQEVTMPSGAQVSSLLLSSTRPAGLLTPDDVAGMTSEWMDKVVITATPLSREMVRALLKAGVRAIIAPTRLAGTPTPAAAAAEEADGSKTAQAGNAPAPSHLPYAPVRQGSELQPAAPAASTPPHASGTNSRGPLPDLDPELLQSYLGMLYGRMMAGEALEDCIHAAEGQCPQLQGAFTLFHA